jgi:hypothetical protein
MAFPSQNKAKLVQGFCNKTIFLQRLKRLKVKEKMEVKTTRVIK